MAGPGGRIVAQCRARYTPGPRRLARSGSSHTLRLNLHRRARPRSPRVSSRTMLLAINIGNTNLATAVRVGDPLVVDRTAPLGVRRTATSARATTDDLEILLGCLLRLDGISLPDVSRIVMASVVPPVGAAVAALAARRGIAMLEATAATLPIDVRVERPAEVGADRLVNALAAARFHCTPAIVVDIGTATTVDAVGSDGAFLGGAITAGPQLSLDALAARTAKLPRVELAELPRAIGRDTAEALLAGAVYGHAGAVKELIARVRAELTELTEGRSPRLILTGGGSRLPWAAGLPGVDAVDPDLTMRGLFALAAEGRWT
jgi:type III pantothenate kinase